MRRISKFLGTFAATFVLGLGIFLLLPPPGAALAAASDQWESNWEESQSLTRAAPSASTEGTPTFATRYYTVEVCAAAGQTLTGGNMAPWWYDDNLVGGIWMPNVDVPKLAVSPTAATRCQAWGHIELGVRGKPYRFLYATEAVTVSGGTTVTVHISKGQ